jgi:hypothetical protein
MSEQSGGVRQRAREDLVDEPTVRRFVGRVEPGDQVSLAVVLCSVALSLALVIGASLWWVASH